MPVLLYICNKIEGTITSIEDEHFLFDMSSWRFILIQLHLITRETQNKINTANKIIIMVMGYTFLLSQTDILSQ